MIKIQTETRLPDGDLVNVYYNPKTRTICDEGELINWTWVTETPVPLATAHRIPTVPVPLEEWDYEAKGWEVRFDNECRHFECLRGAIDFALVHPGATIREME